MPRSKKIDELHEWINLTGIFSSDHVYDEGTKYFTSAQRRVREMAQHGELIRITHEQARQAGRHVGPTSRAQWYCTPQFYSSIFVKAEQPCLF